MNLTATVVVVIVAHDVVTAHCVLSMQGYAFVRYFWNLFTFAVAIMQLPHIHSVPHFLLSLFV